jgi:phosphoribosyl 1,2-cyclic phosphodiesterase
MKIKCWGARGSVPVSGKEYEVYGGDTPCLEIRSRNDEILIIDCGTGVRRLGLELAAARRRRLHVIFTHAHWDHVIGFPFFMPLYIPGTRIEFFGCPFAHDSIRTMLATTMAPPYFPVNIDEVAAELTFHNSCMEPFTIDTVSVEPIALSHPNQGHGFRFTEQGKTFVYLTDNELGYRHPGGLTRDDYLAFSSGADLLIHDAEYDMDEYSRKQGWGHTSYTDALRLALDAGVRSLGLFHHNQERTDRQLDEMVADCRRIIAAEGKSLDCFALTQETVVEL